MLRPFIIINSYYCHNQQIFLLISLTIHGDMLISLFALNPLNEGRSMSIIAKNLFLVEREIGFCVYAV